MLQKIIIFTFLCIGVWSAEAALPPQFSECLSSSSASTLSVADMKSLAEVAKLTFCQNQVGPLGKTDLQNLLASPNIQVGVSLAKTSYSITDLLDLAAAGSYVLYVDSSRLTAANLTALAQAGVQLVLMGTASGLLKSDIIALAAVRPLILNVNTFMSRADLLDYIGAGIDVVVRTSQAGLNVEDITALAQLNSGRVTILP